MKYDCVSLMYILGDLGWWRGPWCSMGCIESPFSNCLTVYSFEYDCNWVYTLWLMVEICNWVYTLWLHLYLSVYSMIELTYDYIWVYMILCSYLSAYLKCICMRMYTLRLCILRDFEFKCALYDDVFGCFCFLVSILLVYFMTDVHDYSILKCMLYVIVCICWVYLWAFLYVWSFIPCIEVNLSILERSIYACLK